MTMKQLIIAVALICFSPSIANAKTHSKGKPNNQPPHVDYQKYDSEFKKWNNFYKVFNDYRLLKSICITESRLNAKAISKDQSLGICQLQLKTWQTIRKRIPTLPVDGYFNPSYSIQAAAYYLKRIKDSFHDSKDIDHFVIASYNVGEGTIHKAHQYCQYSPFKQTMDCLHQLIGKRSIKTVSYVDQVFNSSYLM